MLRRITDKIYYWYEDSSKKEIDFVIKPRNQPIAINVSYTDELPTRELEAFKAFSKIASPERSILVTKKHFERKTLNGKSIELIPLWVFVLLKLF
jgi:predicted AAA+ superfamily ATPase